MQQDWCVLAAGLLLHSSTNPLPSSFLRGGTSKGLFLKRSDLPEQVSDWNKIFLGLMGSPDPDHGRQLNGMGGGVSSLSKIVVIGEPTAEQKDLGIQVEYTFVQVGIRDSSLDYSGNCGNLSSMVGVFAVDQGLCEPGMKEGNRGTVRSFNTNTNKIIETTFPMASSGHPDLDLPEASVAGVPGTASQIILEFIQPGGARTGSLLPSKSPLDDLDISITFSQNNRFRGSLVDATNPTVFVAGEDLAKLPCFSTTFTDTRSEIDPIGYEILELLRQAGSVKMGLTPVAQAQPKIAILSSPESDEDRDKGVDIVVHALSMGVLHKAVPMTVGLCLGVAANMKGTLAWDIVQKARSIRKESLSQSRDLVRIRHQSGIVDVGASFSPDGEVQSAKVVRTGRRLMRGEVWW
ncbi:PrpF protein [Mycena floridula]|nr:PrpF protein [Mycena floridula]